MNTDVTAVCDVTSGVTRADLADGRVREGRGEEAGGRSGEGVGGLGTVVIVDDVASVRAALARTLEARGFKTVTFSGFGEGSRWLEAIEAEEGERRGGGGGGGERGGGVPGVVLIDVHLEDGSGLELAGRARQVLGRRSVVAVVSGDTSIDNLRRVPTSGADVFLAKPVHVPTLVEQIQGWMTRGA